MTDRFHIIPTAAGLTGISIVPFVTGILQIVVLILTGIATSITIYKAWKGRKK